MEKFKTWNDKCAICKSIPTFKSSIFKIQKSASFKYELGKTPEFGNSDGGYDLAFSDVNQRHPVGTIYFYKMAENNSLANLCSLKCAYEYSSLNKSLVLYPDPNDEGKIRGISPDILEINKGLGVPEELKYRGQPCGEM